MRVLVVEDYPRMAKLVRQGLKEEGYAVDLASTGQEGVWLASETEYDAIVLDVMLPDLDGFEVLRRIRGSGRSQPVLMLTARDAVEDRVRGLDLGADDYLIKPFSFAELLARLRALVRRPSEERPPALIVGDLRLDPGAHSAHRGTIPIDLTPTEFALLEYFMRHAGEVLSRTKLLEHVWDFAYEGDSNVVNVYIGYLREKIDRPFGLRTLQTIRGVGYRLAVDGADATSS